MKKILFFIFIVSSLGVSYWIYTLHEHTKEKQLAYATDTYTRAFNTVYDEKKQLAKILFVGLASRINLEMQLARLRTASSAEKNNIRQLLYNDLQPRYKDISKMGIKQVHIHLPNNESFLRMHAPEKFGDDLSATRPTVAYVSTHHTEIDTFEDGIMSYGLRFVFPLFHQGIYVGSMEISFGASSITESIMKQYYVLSNFFLKASPLNTQIYTKENTIYTLSHHQGYYYDGEVLRNLKGFSRKDISELKPRTATTDKIRALGQTDTPSSIHDEEIDAIFTIIPIIHKLTHENLAFLTVRSKASNIILAKKYTYAMMFLSTLALGLIFSFIYMLSNKNRRLKSEVAKKTIELQELNKGLEKTVASQTQQIQQENERFALVLDSIRDGIWDWDLATNKVFFSATWKSMLGYSNEEIIDSPQEWEKRVHTEDIKRVKKEIEENISGKNDVFESIFRMQHKNKSWVWIYARGKTIFDPHGKPIRIVGSHIDVTDENNLKIRLHQLSQIIEEVHDSVITTDVNGIIQTWNQGSTCLFGYTDEETIGQHVSMIHFKEDEALVKESIQTLLAQGFYRNEARLKSKSDQLIHADLSLSLIKDLNGETIGLVSYAKDITDRKNVELELRHQKEILDYQAHYDGLTGLPNRVLLQDRIKQIATKAQRTDKKFALLFIDLDRFKHINDSLGHTMGDLVLKEIAKRLQDTLRAEDTIVRLGGDEFIVLIEDLAHVHDASQLAKKIIETITQPLTIEQHSLYITASIGICFYPEDTSDATQLITYADTAMYKAKNEGRNTFQFYSQEMTQVLRDRVTLESSLRQAIIKQEFVVFFQPQYNAQTDTLVGMEALVRWQREDGKLTPPNDFIPLAEETGMIVEIDKWVMKTAIKQMATWYNEELNPGVLSLNVTMKQLMEKDFIDTIKKTLKEYNFIPTNLKLEITETQMMINAQEIIEKLKKINKLGVKIAIDDFGTGYSSLSYLKKLPIDTLKIDKSFITDLPQDTSNLKLVKTIIALGNNLELAIVAEGVETLEQKNILLEYQCKYIQGYFYSRPLPASDMTTLLHSF